MPAAKEDLMHCPFFKDEYFGMCHAVAFTHVPGIDQLGAYCVRSEHTLCPHYRLAKSNPAHRASGTLVEPLLCSASLTAHDRRTSRLRQAPCRTIEMVGLGHRHTG